MKKNLPKKFQEAPDGSAAVPCALCRGEIWPGEIYYRLDGKRVCEACLERYARVYFAPQRRRLSKTTTRGGSME